MKKTTYALTGILIIAFGLCLLFKELNILHYNIFFEGWWTLFIIIPCFIGLISHEHKLFSLMGLSIGALLLAGKQGIIEEHLSHNLILPTIIIFWGLHTIAKSCCKGKESSFRDCHHNTGAGQFTETKYEGLRDYAVLFSGQDIDMSNQFFQGANMKALFGGFKLDLRDAVIDENARINAQCLFGGVEIIVPNDINVEVTSNCICGGVDMNDLKNPGIGHKTIYINSSCVFGGVDIKH